MPKFRKEEQRRQHAFLISMREKPNNTTLDSNWDYVEYKD
jgi:hypothetical protein